VTIFVQRRPGKTDWFISGQGSPPRKNSVWLLMVAQDGAALEISAWLWGQYDAYKS
jgi:hypothetical protein